MLPFDILKEDLVSFSVLCVVEDRIFLWEFIFKIKLKDYTDDFIQQLHLYTAFLECMYCIKQNVTVANYLKY